MSDHNTRWTCALQLSSERTVVDGSEEDLARAIAAGQDLRVYTEFLHNEHIDTSSDSSELVREVSEFPVTCLIDGRWTAGFMTQRQPVSLPTGFGSPSISFFLYNQDGEQAIARPHLDGRTATGAPGRFEEVQPNTMAKYHLRDSWDEATISPSHNFVYDFEQFRFNVSTHWRELLSCDADGNVNSGSVDALAVAFADGCAVKVGIDGLCAELAGSGDPLRCELFVETHSGYYYTDQKLFIAASRPVVRVAPAIPLLYASHNWDFGWVLVRTDGRVVYRRCDPYSLTFDDRTVSCPIRWFAS